MNIATLNLGVITGRTKRKQPTTDEVRPKTGETNNSWSDVKLQVNLVIPEPIILYRLWGNQILRWCLCRVNEKSWAASLKEQGRFT